MINLCKSPALHLQDLVKFKLVSIQEIWLLLFKTVEYS